MDAVDRARAELAETLGVSIEELDGLLQEALEVKGIDREALGRLELQAEVTDPSPWEG